MLRRLTDRKFNFPANGHFARDVRSEYRARIQRRSERRFRYRKISGLKSLPSAVNRAICRSARRQVARAKSRAAEVSVPPGMTQSFGESDLSFSRSTMTAVIRLTIAALVR